MAKLDTELVNEWQELREWVRRQQEKEKADRAAEHELRSRRLESRLRPRPRRRTEIRPCWPKIEANKKLEKLRLGLAKEKLDFLRQVDMHKADIE